MDELIRYRLAFIAAVIGVTIAVVMSGCSGGAERFHGANLSELAR